jgi:hypothetical protein
MPPGKTSAISWLVFTPPTGCAMTSDRCKTDRERADKNNKKFTPQPNRPRGIHFMNI